MILSCDPPRHAFLIHFGKRQQPDSVHTTVGIYLRNLRAVCNAAIIDGTIPKEVYPFGRHRYTIPAKSNVKKALNRNQVQQIFNYQLPEKYIFPILESGYTPERIKAAFLQTSKQINKYFNRILKEIGITTRVTTIAARHTFSTIMMQNGAKTEFIKGSVGHANVKTTENYLASFDEEIKREFARKLLDFESR